MPDLDSLQPSLLASAKKFGVVPDIHPDDFIFRFIIEHPGFGSKDAAVDYYFSDGNKSSAQLDALIAEWRPGSSTVLEFASGYGCVTRHLQSLARYEITCCDIHDAAVDFIRTRIDTPAVLSHREPELLGLGRQFDVVFALSFFSHMPDRTWGRWLARLLKIVVPTGLLIFTTHGLQSARKHFGEVAIDDRGFWFRPDSEQKDLPVHDYGLTLTTPAYVFRELRGHDEAEPVLFKEAAWWGHQDLYVVRRRARLSPAAPP